MNWNPITNPVDFATLAGVKTPGIARVEGAELERLWQERNGFGFEGAGLIYGGSRVMVEFDLVLELFTVQHWDDWHNVFKPIVLRVPRFGRSQALDFWHPLTADLGLNSVVVKKVGQPTLVDETGIWQIKIGLKRYWRPRPALVKAEESAEAEETSKDPYDQKIEDLLAEYKTLANEGNDG